MIVAIVGFIEVRVFSAAASVPAGRDDWHRPGSVLCGQVVRGTSNQARQSAGSRPTQHVDDRRTDDTGLQRDAAATWLLRMPRTATQRQVCIFLTCIVSSYLYYSPRESEEVCFTGVGLSVCLSVATITKNIVDGFVPNFIGRFLGGKRRPNSCFVTIGRGMWK